MTITWSIKQLDRRVSDGFVVTAHWRCTTVDGEYSVSDYGIACWSEGEPVIPFENLNEETVLEWVWESFNNGAPISRSKADIEANLTSQLNKLKNPVVVPGLPWEK